MSRVDVSDTGRIVRDLLVVAEWFRKPKPPVTDRFGSPTEELLVGMTEKERQTVLLCAEFLSLNHKRSQVSRIISHPTIRDGLDRGLDFESARMEWVEAVRTDPSFIGEDLVASSARATLFPDLSDDEMTRLCGDFRSYLGVVETSFARNRVFLYDHPEDVFVSVIGASLLTIQAGKVGIPWFGVEGRTEEKRDLVRSVAATVVKPL